MFTFTVAFVFDHEKDEIVFYLDGEYLGTKKVDAGRIGALDCNMDGPDSYTGLSPAFLMSLMLRTYMDQSLSIKLYTT